MQVLPGGGAWTHREQVTNISIRDILVPEVKLTRLVLDLQDAFLILLFLFVGVVTRTFRLYFPKEVVFDEAHFGNFTNNYITGHYFHDIHPPLAKLIIAGIAKTLGYNATYVFDMGRPYPTYEYISLRLIPAVFASLVVPLTYLAARAMLCSKLTAVLAGVYVACDLSMIAEGKYILTDGILHFFAILAIFAVFLNDRWHTINSLIFEAICIGCVCAIKYTACGILLFVLYKEFTKVRPGMPGVRFRLQSALWRVGVIIGIVSALHILVFWVHLSILQYKPSDPHEICPDLICNDLVNATNPDWHNRKTTTPMIVKIIFLIMLMNVGNIGVGYSHPYASHMASWPLFLRKWVLFYAKDNHIIACMGNWFTWWPVFFSVIFMCIRLTRRRFWGSGGYFSSLTVGYLCSYLPFLLIPRDLFLYHYSIPFLFGVVLTASIIDKYLPPRTKGFVVAALCSCAVFGFLLWSPIAYGLRIDDINFLTWRRQWRY